MAGEGCGLHLLAPGEANAKKNRAASQGGATRFRKTSNFKFSTFRLFLTYLRLFGNSLRL